MFSSWKERNTFSICLLVLPKHWTYDITKIITFSRIERCTLTFHLIISEVASGNCWSSVNETAKKAQRSQITARTLRSSLVCNIVQNVTFKKHKINLRVLRLKWPGFDPDSCFFFPLLRDIRQNVAILLRWCGSLVSAHFEQVANCNENWTLSIW